MEIENSIVKSTKMQAVIRYLMIALFAIAAALFLNQLIGLLQLKNLSAAYEVVEKRQFSRPLQELVILSGIMVPVIEELVFRLFLYERVKKIKGAVFAGVASAVLFALYHMNLVQCVYAFFMGLCICLVYERCDGYISGLFFHVSANLFVIGSTFIKVFAQPAVMIGSCALGGIVTCVMICRFYNLKS